MFYYYGRKKALARHYPEPAHDAIVEPFAGAAAYSLHGDRWKREVTLVELDAEVVELWLWLQAATPKQIMALPVPEPGELLDDLNLSRPEHLLLSLHCGPGKNRRNGVVSKFSRWTPGRRYVADAVEKTRHWRIIEGDYREAPDIEATWFIDPPYQGQAGRHYRHSDIDYGELGDWCRSRRGQVIVCDQIEADWLPFETLRPHRSTSGGVKIEGLWLSDGTVYDCNGEAL